MPKRHTMLGKAKSKPPSSSLFFRIAVFAGIFVVVAALVYLLMRPPASTEAPDAQPIVVDMAGYAPNVIQARAGSPIKVRLINPDSQFHTDGGGKHQFAIPELGLDVILQPESDRVVTFTAAKAGTYTFYCDICCGGKENPLMQGTLKVVA